MTDAQDAARYRFIRDHLAYEAIHHVQGDTSYSTWKIDVLRSALDGVTFDDAIDKAIEHAELAQKRLDEWLDKERTDGLG